MLSQIAKNIRIKEIIKKSQNNQNVSSKMILLFFSPFLILFFQGGKGAPYYVGAAQTLPRGMYSDRNKNIIGKFFIQVFLFCFCLFAISA